jgi:hypothetical protein
VAPSRRNNSSMSSPTSSSILPSLLRGMIRSSFSRREGNSDDVGLCGVSDVVGIASYAGRFSFDDEKAFEFEASASSGFPIVLSWMGLLMKCYLIDLNPRLNPMLFISHRSPPHSTRARRKNRAA